MAIDLAAASSLTSVLVGLLALAMAAAAWAARRRSGNRQLAFVAWAFGLFAAKSAMSAYAVQTHFVPHDEIELLLSLADLAIIVLLAAPLVLRSRA